MNQKNAFPTGMSTRSGLPSMTGACLPRVCDGAACPRSAGYDHRSRDGVGASQ